eukprot:2883594-Lingulodinium_polyedra.AAC.1
MLHDDAVKTTVRRRNGSLTARSRAPRARARQLARPMEYANVRYARRYGRGRSVRPHHCVTFCKRCAMMRSDRPFAAAMAR